MDPAHAKHVRTRLRKWLRWVSLGFLLLGAAWFLLPWAFPIPSTLVVDAEGSPLLLDRHGKPIRHLVSDDFTRSAPVPLSEIPPQLIDCSLAAEDKRFREHHGIDFLATARSAYDLLRNRKVVSGASTVTQQLAKLSLPPGPRTIGAKIREALLARRLEMSWSKDRILTAYFSKLDYGNLRIGPKEAARFYFQKPLRDLSLGQCALLAGLPQAPSRLNPIRNPNNALARREMVLDRLEAGGKYGSSEIDIARSEPLLLRPLKERLAAPWLRRLPDGEKSLRSTLDLDLQREIERIVSEETARLKSSNLRHAAVVVIDNSSGEILAMVSSADWRDARGGQVHGALSPRSPGSTLKPFTYLLSFRELGYFPGTVIADIPTRLRTEQGLQLPENYDRRFRGPVTIRQALACSLNVPALRELNDLGGPAPLYELLRKLGITTLDEPAAHYGLGLTLGNAPVNLLELTNAYACLARSGLFLPTRLFMDEKAAEPVRLIDETAAWMISDILSDPKARAPSFSSGGPLDSPFRCAVKTGTSSDFRDNWCIGYTPEFTVGVWAGNFENQPMKGLSGVSGAAPIFHRAMVSAHKLLPPTWPSIPEEITEVTIDVRTGKTVPTGPIREIAEKFTASEWNPRGNLVPIARAADYDLEGKVKLSAEYRDWFASPQNLRRGELAMEDASASHIPLEIDRPRDGAILLLDPELPGGGKELKFLTNLPEFTSWRCDTLEVRDDIAILEEGTHVLIVTDTRDASEKRITIQVRKL